MHGSKRGSNASQVRTHGPKVAYGCGRACGSTRWARLRANGLTRVPAYDAAASFSGMPSSSQTSSTAWSKWTHSQRPWAAMSTTEPIGAPSGGRADLSLFVSYPEPFGGCGLHVQVVGAGDATGAAAADIGMAVRAGVVGEVADPVCVKLRGQLGAPHPPSSRPHQVSCWCRRRKASSSIAVQGFTPQPIGAITPSYAAGMAA